VSFSFQFWQQVEYFGFDGKNPEWFVSLLERLRDLSREADDFLRRNARVLHFHKINWSQTNIPITREDLTWLPREFLDDPENDLVQFSVSSALGRIAGYQDGAVFYIVLIDPHHNLQPTKSYDYRVAPCSPLVNELEIVLANLSHIENSQPQCTPELCSIKPQLRVIKYRHQDHGIVYIRQHYLDCLNQMVQDGKAKSLEDCIETVIVRKSFD